MTSFQLHPDAGRVLAAGLRWIYETEQPDGSIPDHHGYGRRAGDNIFRFCAAGFNRLPVVVVDRVSVQRDGLYKVLNPLTPAEVDAIANKIEQLGRRVADRWNGANLTAGPCSTGSFGLADPAHPTLLAGLNRYRSGCPTHGTVFCYHDGCPWSADGHALTVKPDWPTTGAAQ